MTIITQDKSKIYNLPEETQWQIWISENIITKRYEMFLIVGRTGSQEKIAEYNTIETAQFALENILKNKNIS